MEKEYVADAKKGCERNTAPHKKQKILALDQLTREELVARVQQLEAHNTQLRNLLAKSQGRCGESREGSSSRKAKKPRPFDFSKHSRRHVLLKFAYLGWDYQGYATQEDTQATIEAQLFSALLKTRLIESRETSKYHRCGRTDKGVSAFEQVISITLRSSCQEGVGVEGPQNPSFTETLSESHKDTQNCQEINYVSLLNRVLPTEIRMLAWCPVPVSYSARFDCSARTYKYFFPRANLNLQLMQEAADHLVGHHDFRNFCKMDVANGVVSFHRRILAITINTLAADVALRRKGTQREKQVESDKGEGNKCGKVDTGEGLNDTTNQRITPAQMTLHIASHTTPDTHNQNSSEDIHNSDCTQIHDDKTLDGKSSNSKCSLDHNSSHQYKEDFQREHFHNSGCDLTRNSKAVTNLHCEQNDPANEALSLDSGGYEMCVATIEGEAFLWHQIRCIMAVLVMVGEGWESPSVVQQLLDVTTHPRKPQYNMASEVPLNLYGTSFPGVAWHWDNESLLTITQLQQLWTQHSVRASMIRSMLWDLEQEYQAKRKEEEEKEGMEKRDEKGEEMKKEKVREERHKLKQTNVRQQSSCLVQISGKEYRPLLSRPTCESLEARVQHYIKRRRLDPTILLQLHHTADTEEILAD